MTVRVNLSKRAVSADMIEDGSATCSKKLSSGGSAEHKYKGLDILYTFPLADGARRNLVALREPGLPSAVVYNQRVHMLVIRLLIKLNSYYHRTSLTMIYGPIRKLLRSGALYALIHSRRNLIQL